MRNDPRSFFLRLGYETGQSTHIYGQWKHFGRTLLGRNGAVWLLCCAGIIPIDLDRFPVPVAPVFMCFVVTVVFVYLMCLAHSQEENLVLKALAIRTESAEEQLAAEMGQQG